MTPELTDNLPQIAYSAQQVKENEALVAAQQNIPMYSLMQSAAQAVFDLMLVKYRHAKKSKLLLVAVIMQVMVIGLPIMRCNMILMSVFTVLNRQVNCREMLNVRMTITWRKVVILLMCLILPVMFILMHYWG